MACETRREEGWSLPGDNNNNTRSAPHWLGTAVRSSERTYLAC